MSADSAFIETDATERWTKIEFQQYSSASRGWRYTPQRRHINMSPNGNSAWFDEIRLSESFGSSRGSGILISTGQDWKISPYRLTLPIPNGMVGAMSRNSAVEGVVRWGQ